MTRKVVGILIFMLVSTTILPLTALAGDEENPEITDISGDARTYLDIQKAWFYEDPSTPDVLYTTIKLTKPSKIPFKQHLVISWQMNGEHYASMLGIGYNIGMWMEYVSIIGRGQLGDPQPIITYINGSFDTTDGTVTCIIPKNTIGDPEPGDILTYTKSECFQRFRLWGRCGFSPIIRLIFFDEILGMWQLEDLAPDQGYGTDYIIQY